MTATRASSRQQQLEQPMLSRPKRHAEKRFYDETEEDRPQHLTKSGKKKKGTPEDESRSGGEDLVNNAMGNSASSLQQKTNAASRLISTSVARNRTGNRGRHQGRGRGGALLARRKNHQTAGGDAVRHPWTDERQREDARSAGVSERRPVAASSSAAPAERVSRVDPRRPQQRRSPSSGVGTDKRDGGRREAADADMDVDKSDSGDVDEDDDTQSGDVWVQCDTCRKWRRLPDYVDASRLPAKWHCKMNVYDESRASCSTEQEKSPTSRTEVSSEEPMDDGKENNLRKFLGGWARRLRCSDKAEARLAPSMSTRGRRKAPGGEVHWVQCQHCGKWRALLQSMLPSSVVGHGLKWMCVMNTWDEALASCSAPQESQYSMEVLFPHGLDESSNFGKSDWQDEVSDVADDEAERKQGHNKGEARRRLDR